MSAALLAVEHLSKSFPGVKALDDVSMSIASGEIVALIGQNGSGKSTLVKILAGVYRADPGGAVSLAQDEDGESSSLHFIHQDLGLVPTLSTIENLDIGRELDGRRALRRVPAREERLRAETLIREFGADFDVTRPVATLTAAERSIVGIARALEGWTHDRNVLVLDEPTAALHGDEVEKLFVAVRQVASRGAGVIFISHRLDEVMDLTDRVVALRDGRLIADLPREQVRHDDLVQLIAGREVSRQESATHELGSPVLRARRVTGTTLRGVDLTIRSGEVVGVSGVLGSGRDELASVLFGASPGGVAEMWVDGEPADGLDPRRAIAAGVAFVPSDRHRRSAVMRMSARENMTIPRLYPLRRRLTGLIDRRLESREVGRWVSSVDVRPALPERPIALFSGGNQQKIILAKWLRNEPRVLLLEEPTQGIDVGARAGIYELVAAAAAAGAGVLVCSSDTEELAQICHRVLVLRDGRQVAELTGPQVTEAALIRASVGPIEEDSHRAAHTDTIDKEVPLDV